MYKEAAEATLKGFYYQHASMPLEPQYAGKWLHRPSEPDVITDPVPGLMVGGSNLAMQDSCSYPFREVETAYLDSVCSYATNEIAINWNAPIVYLAGAIAALQKNL